jgi:hypothetical protein
LCNFELIFIFLILIADKENTKIINSEKGKTLEDADKCQETVEGSRPFHNDQNKSDVRVGNQKSEDRSSKFRLNLFATYTCLGLLTTM